MRAAQLTSAPRKSSQLQLKVHGLTTKKPWRTELTLVDVNFGMPPTRSEHMCANGVGRREPLQLVACRTAT